MFNSVAGFSGGVSCPSEEQGEAVLFSGADLFSLSLPFRLTASQADSGSSSFPTDSHETTSPSVVQVSVDVHAVPPIGHTSVQVGCQRVSLVLCWTGVHSILCVVA